jgi:hypothetical protein
MPGDDRVRSPWIVILKWLLIAALVMLDFEVMVFGPEVFSTAALIVTIVFVVLRSLASNEILHVVRGHAGRQPLRPRPSLVSRASDPLWDRELDG